MSHDAIQWTLQAIKFGRLTVEELAMLVPYAQRELGVADDGKAGPGTMEALRVALNGDHVSIQTLPVPKGRRNTHAMYGNPAWTRTKGRGVDLDDGWVYRNIRTFQLHTGKRVRLHKLVGGEFVRLFKAACEASGYTPRSVQTFVQRTIGKSDRLSMHALGVAVDFDPNSNWLGGVQRERVDGKWTVTDKPALLLQHPAFAKVWEDAGWVWGHRWSFKDTHHFQRAVP